MWNYKIATARASAKKVEYEWRAQEGVNSLSAAQYAFLPLVKSVLRAPVINLPNNWLSRLNVMVSYPLSRNRNYLGIIYTALLKVCCYCHVVGIIFAHKPLLLLTTSCAKCPN